MLTHGLPWLSGIWGVEQRAACQVWDLKQGRDGVFGEFRPVPTGPNGSLRKAGEAAGSQARAFSAMKADSGRLGFSKESPCHRWANSTWVVLIPEA